MTKAGRAVDKLGVLSTAGAVLSTTLVPPSTNPAKINQTAMFDFPKNQHAFGANLNGFKAVPHRRATPDLRNAV